MTTSKDKLGTDLCLCSFAIRVAANGAEAASGTSDSAASRRTNVRARQGAKMKATARLLGWDGETRGRGGRRQKLASVVQIATIQIANRTEIDADLGDVARWLRHLREERVVTAQELGAHLDDLRQFHTSNHERQRILSRLYAALDDVSLTLHQSMDEYRPGRRERATLALARLRGWNVESIGRMRRRTRTVRVVSTDLNALAELRGHDPQEDFRKWRQQKHKRGVIDKWTNQLAASTATERPSSHT